MRKTLGHQFIDRTYLGKLGRTRGTFASRLHLRRHRQMIPIIYCSGLTLLNTPWTKSTYHDSHTTSRQLHCSVAHRLRLWSSEATLERAVGDSNNTWTRCNLHAKEILECKQENVALGERVAVIVEAFLIWFEPELPLFRESNTDQRGWDRLFRQRSAYRERLRHPD